MKIFNLQNKIRHLLGKVYYSKDPHLLKERSWSQWREGVTSGVMKSVVSKINKNMKRIIKKMNRLGTATLLMLILSSFLFPDPVAAANAWNIRQEINITDGYFAAAANTVATSSAIILYDSTKYSGTQTVYFEAVASTSASFTNTITLRRNGTGTDDCTINIPGGTTSYTLIRSSACTLPAGETEYVARISSSASGTTGVKAVRLVVLQSFADDTNSAATSTQTQIEIGSATSSASNTNTLPLQFPKYWNYDSSKWDGGMTVYAEVTYKVASYAASSTVYNVGGSYTYVVSPGTSYTVVDAWGAGGAGVDGNNTGGGAGGGGGAFASSTVYVTPGTSYSIVVGDGGVASGDNGTDSTFGASVVVADAGLGGTGNTTSGGAGGTVANSTGTVEYAGGNGGNGNGTDDAGGGGGGAAGPHGNGGNGADASTTVGGGGGGGDGGTAGSGSTGGTSTFGGDGGAGDTNGSTAPNGIAGTSDVDGGGGGGGGDQASTAGNGGAPGGGGGGGETGHGTGGDGQIKLTEFVGAVGVAIEESDGTGDGFQGWTFKKQIVSGGSSTSTARVRSASFTPITGRNYRLVASTTGSGSSYDIYNAKIVVDQYSAQFTLLSSGRPSGSAVSTASKMDSTILAITTCSIGCSIYKYTWDGISTWNQSTGSGVSITAGHTIAHTGLDSTTIAFLDDSDSLLTTYVHGGSSWSTSGSSLNLGSMSNPKITTLSSTKIAYIDETNKQLRTYTWNGSTWSQTGNSLTLSGVNFRIIGLNSSDIALVEENNYQVQKYTFDGTNWSTAGNAYQLSGPGYGLATLGASRVMVSTTTSASFSVLDFDGTDWSQNGSDLTVPNGLVSQIVGLDTENMYISTSSLSGATFSYIAGSQFTKLEPQYLLANTRLDTGTGLQSNLTKWDSSEWTGTTATYLHAVDAVDNSTSVVTLNTAAGTLLTNSTVTSPDNHATSTTGVTMPANGNLDMKATTNNNDVYASRILVQASQTITVATVTISGTVYTDEGSTAMTTGPTVRVKVNGAGDYSAVANGSGVYSISNVTIGSAGDVVTVYLDGATEDAVLVTKAADTTSNISALNLYQNRVIIRNEHTGSLSNTNLDQYDSGNDADIGFVVTTSNLTVADGFKLIIWTGDTFTPGGTVTTSSSAVAADADGDILIQASATMTMSTNALSVGGDFTNSGGFTSSGTTTFTATGLGFGINSTNTFYDVVFNGSGGEWSLQAVSAMTSVTITTGTLKISDQSLSAGTISVGASGTLHGGSSTINIQGSGTGASRPFKVDGVFTASTGTVIYTSGGNTTIEATTYNALNFQTTLYNDIQYESSGAIVADSLSITSYNFDELYQGLSFNFSLGGSLTVNNNISVSGSGVVEDALMVLNTNGYAVNTGSLTIDGSSTVNAGSSTITLTGSGTPFSNSGTFTTGASTVNYTGTSATNITATTYNNLSFTPASSATYTLPASTLTLRGNLSIGANTTITKGAGTIVFAKGSTGQTWTDSTAGIQDIGAVQVSANSGNTTLTLGANAKFTSMTVDSSQTFSQGASYNVTTTGAGTVMTINGEWSNLGTGDVVLSGNVSNAGTITLNSSAGSQCTDSANDIAITSSSGGTQRTWSGAGTFTLYNLAVTDMLGALTPYNSTMTNSNWTNGVCTVAVSGTVYTDEGSTAMGSGRTVRIKVSGAGDYTTTTAANGTYTVSGVVMNAGDTITAFLDGATEDAVTISRSNQSSGTLTGFNLYQNFVIVRDEYASAISNSEFDLYDSGQDADINFTVTAGALTVLNSNTLYVLSGTFTPGGAVTASAFKQVGGTFNGGSGSITVNGNYTLSGGTFNSTSGTLLVNAGNWTHTGGGTFNHNGGTVNISHDVYGTTYTIDVSTTETFNNLSLGDGDGNRYLTIASGDTLVAIGTFTHFGGRVNGGTVEAEGPVSIGSSAQISTFTISYVTSGDQTITGNGGITGNLNIAKPSGTVSVVNDLNIGSFTLSGGTFTAPSGTLSFYNGDWTHTAGGTFNHNSGTVVMMHDEYVTTHTIDVATTETFNNLTIGNGDGNRTTAIGSSDILVVLGTFTHNGNVLNAGTIEARGNVVISGGVGGTTQLSLTGSSAQTITNSGGTAPAGMITINKTSSSDTVTLASNYTFTNGLLIAQGTFSQGASYNYTTASTTVLYANGTWSNVGTGDIVLGGNVTNAGVITLNSNAGSQCTDSANDIAITSSSGGTQRTWSGAGTFTLYNLAVTDMLGALTPYNSTMTNSNWSNGASCSNVTYGAGSGGIDGGDGGGVLVGGGSAGGGSTTGGGSGGGSSQGGGSQGGGGGAPAP